MANYSRRSLVAATAAPLFARSLPAKRAGFVIGARRNYAS